MDENLEKHRFTIASRWHLYENAIETIDHIFIHCPFSKDLWDDSFILVDKSIDLSRDFEHLFGNTINGKSSLK